MADANALRMSLRSCDTPATRAAADDPNVVAAMLEMLRATFEMGKDGAAGVALGAGTKMAALAGVAADRAGTRGGKAAVFVSKESLQTLNLIRIVDQTPGAVLATVGATLLTKTALAFDLAGDDDRKAKVLAAWTDLAGQALAFGVSAAEAGATGGLATPIAILNGAALIAAAMKVAATMREGG